jgi:hypothetical protein
MTRWTPRLAYPIVFGAGFCILLIEITAGRLLAPSVGVSLETWTGIIGTVLMGFAIGDTLGGRLIDRHPRPRVIAFTLALAGTSVLLIPSLAEALRGAWPDAPLLFRVMAIAAAVLLVPSTLLAAVAPMATRLAVRAVTDAGRTVGGLGAVGSASSVLGVVLGAFVFLEHFGVRAIVWAAGVGLVLLSLLPALVVHRDDPGGIGSGAAIRASAPGVAWSWTPYLLAAASGASIMAVELSTARLAAIMFGTSLYVWASVIGLVLLGISLGNILGGWLADRDPTRRPLGLLCALAGASTLGVLVVIVAYARFGKGAIGLVLGSLPPAAAFPLLFGPMLLAPPIFFGAITPVVIRLSMRDVRASGDLVGRVYAAQAIGSIVGTFAAGFVLIAHLGARAVILVVAVGAVLMGTLAGDLWPRRTRPAMQAMAVAAFGFVLVASAARWIPSPCLRESNYYCISVRNQGENLRALVLDNLVHSYVDLKDPTSLPYEYEQGFALLVADLAARRTPGGPPMRMLFIGGGGYSLPQYVQHVYGDSLLDVVEIDAAVTAVTYDHLGMPRSTPIRSWNEDGRQFFLRRPVRQYDLVFGDAFRDAYSVPYHLTTVEFARLVADALKEDGVYAVNVIDGRTGLFLRSYVRTLAQVFRWVSILPVDRAWRQSAQTTFVVLASQAPLDLDLLLARRPPGVPKEPTLVRISGDDLSRYLKDGPSMVLTDDRAPVENYLARVYADVMRRRPR